VGFLLERVFSATFPLKWVSYYVKDFSMYVIAVRKGVTNESLKEEDTLYILSGQPQSK